MRRGYRIIHLYDKPLRLRPPSWRRFEVISNSAGPRLVACVTIVLATGVFFLLYDATVHHQRPAIPMRSQSSSFRTIPSASTTANTAIVPDMNSPQVAFANADVDLSHPKAPEKLDDTTAKIPEGTKAEAKMPKPKKLRTIKPPRRDQAAQNPTFGFRLFQFPFGQN
jgi:hypothetical protein